MMIRANMFLMKTQVIIRIMMIIFSSSISTTLLNEDGQKRRRRQMLTWNPQQRTSFGYRLLACIDTDSGQNNMVTRWTLDGGDDGGHRYGRDNANAKENYYIGRTMMNRDVLRKIFT